MCISGGPYSFVLGSGPGPDAYLETTLPGLREKARSMNCGGVVIEAATIAYICGYATKPPKTVAKRMVRDILCLRDVAPDAPAEVRWQLQRASPFTLSINKT